MAISIWPLWPGTLSLACFPHYCTITMHFNTSTAEDGTFRIVTIPGPVLLIGGVDHDWSPAGQAYRSIKYKRATADPRYPQYFPAGHPGAYASADGGFPGLQGSYCKVLQIEPGTTVKQDITVEPASTILIKIQDATGRPLVNTLVWEEGRHDGFGRSDDCA